MIVVCEKNRIIILFFILVIILSDAVGQSNYEEVSVSKENCTSTVNCFFVPVCGRVENGSDNITNSVDDSLLYNSEDLIIYKGNITHEEYFFYTPDACMRRYDNISALIQTVHIAYFEFLPEGRIKLPGVGDAWNNDSYCVNPIVEQPGDVFVCGWFIVPKNIWTFLYPICINTIITILILLIVFIIHATSSKAKPSFKMALCGYCICTLVFYIVFTILGFGLLRWIKENLNDSQKFVTHFSEDDSYIVLNTIASYINSVSNFYVNVMSFDIWWTFRKTLPSKNRDKKLERIKMGIYSVYVWTIPTIIHLCIYFKKCEEDVDNIILLVLAGCNAIFFIATVWNIVKIRKEIATRCNNVGSQQHNKNKKSLLMYFKLFILTGMGIGLTNVSSILSEKVPSTNILLIVVMFLQGPTLIVSFIWKDKASSTFWTELKEVIRTLINKVNHNDPTNLQGPNNSETSSEQIS